MLLHDSEPRIELAAVSTSKHGLGTEVQRSPAFDTLRKGMRTSSYLRGRAPEQSYTELRNLLQRLAEDLASLPFLQFCCDRVHEQLLERITRPQWCHLVGNQYEFLHHFDVTWSADREA